MKIDLHMHSNISDGTDTPEELLSKIRQEKIDVFSLTDHDDIEGCESIRKKITDKDPFFINGVEFSCMDENGKYHILGYDFIPQSPDIIRLVSEAKKIV